MYGRDGGIVVGPLIIVWATRRLIAYLRESTSLLGEHPREIRPDEFAPLLHLRLRIAMVTLFYGAAIAFGVFGTILSLSELFQ